MTAREIKQAIASGELDDVLDQVADMVHDRRKALKGDQALKVKAALFPGCKVTIGEAVRPKYLAGAHGTFSGEFRGSRAVIDFDYLPKSSKRWDGWRMTLGSIAEVDGVKV